MADTLTYVLPRSPTVREEVGQALVGLICRRYGHRWQLMGRAIAGDGRNLPHGTHDCCSRCRRHRVTFLDGNVEEFTHTQALAADTRLAEALYEARWGERPRVKLTRGQWPAV